MKDKKNESGRTNTDAILKNLTSTKDVSRDGNFINYEDDDSFSSINTSRYGEEADVDDL